jgi:hypothetical protein
MFQLNKNKGVMTQLNARWVFHKITLFAVLCGMILSFVLDVGSSSAAGEVIFALTTTNRLVKFSSDNACNVLSAQNVTGLQPSENLLGIDFRPLNGQLYGLGSTGRLYVIDPQTAAAAAVSTQPFTVTLQGSNFGFDFNPTVDRIRIVSDAGQNLRAHPDTGAIVAVDGTLAYSSTDTFAGVTPAIVSAAYTNPDNDPNTGTTLYDMDAGRDILAIQNPPNNGTLNTVGSLNFNTKKVVGFDISTSGVAYAVLLKDGDPPQNCGKSHFVSVDLATGRVNRLGFIGVGEWVRGLAVPTQTSP